jgi:DNA-binding transcriptional ArsR family regulator
MGTAEIFRTLGDPTRLAVFECIAVEELSVSDLTQRFRVSQPAISQHLSVLKHCGLAEQRRVGKNIFYKADPKGMRPMIDWLSHYRGFWQDRLPKLGRLLKEMKNGS